jgi:hypothetical protein
MSPYENTAILQIEMGAFETVGRKLYTEVMFGINTDLKKTCRGTDRYGLDGPGIESL